MLAPNYAITQSGERIIDGIAAWTNAKCGGFNEGDRITFILDCNEGTFSCKVNDGEQEILFNIVKRKEIEPTGRWNDKEPWIYKPRYNMTIILGTKGDSITLEEFVMTEIN